MSKPSEWSENPPQASRVEYFETRVDCPSCGGWGDHGLDDEGKVYTCYTCYGEGSIAAGRLEEGE